MQLDAASRSCFKDRLSRARAEIAAGRHHAALVVLRDCITPEADFVTQARVAKCAAGIDLAQLGLRPLRIAIVAASTMEHFAGVLRFWLARAGFASAILVTPFDTAAHSVLGPASELHGFKPDIVWLFSTFRDLELPAAPGADAGTVQDHLDRALDERRQAWATLQERFGCIVIQNNADIPADDPFGNLAGAAPWGSRSLQRRYNAELALAAPRGVMIFDLDHVASLWGKRRWTDQRYWFHSRHAFALDASGPVAYAASQLIAGACGMAKKCLVVDLDNTLWGGVIGDDGLAGIALGSGADGEAFAAFQRFIKALKERGVILAACSKNDPAVAAAVFDDHPDSVLRPDDFAVFRVNWDNKADNIRHIAATLNIGLDAIVFVDDNPMERDIVRRHVPEVAVVDLPDDPALFVAALASQAWFESTAFSAEDAERSRYYAGNARRAVSREAYVDMDEYLRSLDMVATVGGVDAFHLPRIAQLINKSNQFHLTGTRYSEAEIAQLGQQPNCCVRHVRLRDRFGDNGLIACVVLLAQGTALHVDTWVMSCRVLGRSVEEFIANEIVAAARARGCDRLIGHYVRSAKNGLVAGLYSRLGFELTSEDAAETTWTFYIDRAQSGWKTWVRLEGWGA